MHEHAQHVLGASIRLFLRRPSAEVPLLAAGQAVYVCPPKTQSSYRTIPLPQTVVDALADHLHGRDVQPEAFIFTAPSGGPVVRTSFMHSTWTPAAKAAGLGKGVGLHSLRHFYASALIRGGLSVKVVSERLGHANAAMTLNVYAHLWPDDEDRTRQALDDLFSTSGAPSAPRPDNSRYLRRSSGT